MTKSFNKFKKPCFWFIFGPFSLISIGQNKFVQKIQFCDAQLHMDF